MFSMLQYRTTFFQFFCVQFYRFCNASRFNHADIYVDTKTINKKARVSGIACGIGSEKKYTNANKAISRAVIFVLTKPASGIPHIKYV